MEDHAPGDTGQDAMEFTGEGKDDAMETDEPNSSDAKDDVLEAPARQARQSSSLKMKKSGVSSVVGGSKLSSFEM